MASNIQSNFEVRLQQLSKRLNELKTDYELYFAGQLRVEPAKEHAQWKREFESFQSSDTKSTSQKFKLKNLQSRYVQLSTLWAKTVKQIEEGTYRRDKFQAKFKTAPQNSPAHSENDKLADKLYEKLREAYTKAGSKVPPKEKLSENISKRISEFKQKHPKEKLEIKLVKDKSGHIQIQLKPKK